MLTAVLVSQVAFNLLLLFGLWRLLQERTAAVRVAAAREDRLEALAKEFCTLGGELVRETQGVPAVPAPEPPVAAPAPDLPAGRVEGAAALLEQGLPVEHVAEATTMPAGEVEVLNNLRRARQAAKSPRARAAAEPGSVKPRKAAPARRAARAAVR
jgi:hypothetical protein